MQPTVSNLETKLPRAIQRQMDGVNARLDERAKQRTAAAGTPPAPEPNAPAAAATTEGETTPPAGTPPAPPAAPAQPADRENDPVYWRERFRVMQGINEKLRTDHREDLAQRDRQHESLTTRVQELEQQLATRPADGKGKIDLTAFFTPEQIESFGEVQCEAMARAAQTAAREQAQQLIDAEVKPLKEKAKTDDANKAKQVEARFFEELERLVPNYQEIDAEDAWLTWLNGKNEDGETHQKRLSRLQKAGNATGVANVFRDFLKTKTKLPEPPAVPKGGAGGDGGGGNTPPATGGKGYPSREEIRDYSKRAATVRNPRDPRFVTAQERAEFEARLRLPKP